MTSVFYNEVQFLSNVKFNCDVEFNGNVIINGNLIINGGVDHINYISEELKNLLIFKNILTEEEINDYIDSLKVMDKLTKEN